MRRLKNHAPLGILFLILGFWLAAAPVAVLADPPARPVLENTLPIGLTEEEMTRLHEIGMDHRSTDPPLAPIRQCAEWEPVTGVLIRYSSGFGIPYSIIREYAEDIEVHVLVTASQQSSCYSNMAANGVNMDNVVFINVSTNSIWTRDYGPQFVFANDRWAIVDHIYNRPRPQDDAVNWALGPAWGCEVYGTDLIHTGGNYMCDGHGTGFSTDLVWNENPSLTHAQIAQEMEDYLGITDYVVVPDISAYGIHHIDCWGKLLDEETILIKEVWASHPDYPELEANAAYYEGLTNCYGRPYNVVRVYSGSIGGNEVASYTNSLILNNKVFVPVFGISSDAGALATYEAAMPGYEVLGYTGSWYSDDAIHCRGMGIHDKYMLRVDTNRLADFDENAGDYPVTAFIDDRSEAGLVADSLLVFWRLEGDVVFDAVTMQATADPDSYYADIPHQADEVNVEYYILAKDNSGRRQTRPMVAPAAWYTFNTGTTPTSVAAGGVSPVSVALLESYPNPFNPVMTARYRVASPGPVDLSIYSTEGRLVRRLADGDVGAGTHEVTWDGTDASGEPVASGVYFLRLVTAEESASKRVVLLK